MNVTPEQAKALRRLVTSSDWVVVEEIAAHVLDFNAFNLLAWIESDEWDVERQARDARGGYHFWRQLQAVIEKAVTYEQETEIPVE